MLKKYCVGGQYSGKLDAYLANSVCLSIHVAMTDMKAMVEIVYKPLPTDDDVARYKALADDLRSRLL